MYKEHVAWKICIVWVFADINEVFSLNHVISGEGETVIVEDKLSLSNIT